VPRMAFYQEKYKTDLTRFPVATEISDDSIALPVGPHVDSDDLDYIIDQLTSILSEISSS